MTLKKKNGQWSHAKLGLFFAGVGTIATCVIAAPIGIDYLKTAMAPWTTLPNKVDQTQHDVADMRTDLSEIKRILAIQGTIAMHRTNAYQISKYGEHDQ